MNKQTGCIGVEGENWFLRWRESVNGVRKLRYKTLGPVTSDHRRNKDRSTGKLRIPAEIQEAADSILAGANGASPDKSLMALAGMMMESSPELAQKLVGIGSVSRLEVANSLRELMARPQDRRKIGDVAKDFFEKREAFSFGTRKVYDYAWRYLKPKIENRVLADFGRADAFRLWQDIKAENPHLRRNTFNAMRGFLGSLFEWASDNGLYEGENPSKASLPEGVNGSRETEAYTIAEIRMMLSQLFTDQPRTLALIAIAFGGGLRRSEIAGLGWEDYQKTESGAVLHVRRGVYRGRVGKTKTKGSTGDVALGAAFCEFVDAYRASIGNPSEGFMFSHGKKPIGLDAVARNFIRPQLNYCAECERRNSGKGKRVGYFGPRLNHVDSPDDLGKFPGLEDHVYVPRSAVLPDWKGWHAFRRGSATFLASVTEDELAALQLRHSNVSTTQAHYIKGRTKQDERIAAAKKVIEITAQKGVAAGALSQGLKVQ